MEVHPWDFSRSDLCTGVVRRGTCTGPPLDPTESFGSHVLLPGNGRTIIGKSKYSVAIVQDPQIVEWRGVWRFHLGKSVKRTILVPWLERQAAPSLPPTSFLRDVFQSVGRMVCCLKQHRMYIQILRHDEGTAVRRFGK